MPSGYPVQLPSKTELQHLIKQGYSREQLAKHFKVAWSTVRTWLHNYGIKFPGKSKLDTKEMIHLYFDKGLTLKEISKLSGLSPNGVEDRITQTGLVLRTPQDRINQTDKDRPFLEVGLKPLEPYIDNLTPRLCVCTACGNKISPTRANIWRGQGGCKYCANKALSASDKDKHFLEAGLIPLEPFVSSNTPRRCRCKKCGREVNPRHNDLQQGQGGCRYCAGNVEQDPGKSVLEELYVKKKLSSGEVAEILGLSSTTVQKYLELHEIPRRAGYEKYGCERPANEVLEQWYIIEEMTTYEIGKLCNTSSKTIGKWLREANIPIRPAGSTHGVYRKKMLSNNPRLYKAPAYIYLLKYITETESYLKIGIGRESSRRLENHRSAGAEILQVRKDILYNCYVLEQNIRKEFKKYRYYPHNPKMAGGHTECFLFTAPIDLFKYPLVDDKTG